MQDEIIRQKIEKSLELICQLYKDNLITDAYIVGSLVKGTARKESDIDLIIINPLLLNAADMPPIPIVLPYSQSEDEKITESLRIKIADVLKNIGVEFKELYLKDIILWYQLYKGELFHIMTRNEGLIEFPNIQITRKMCE